MFLVSWGVELSRRDMVLFRPKVRRLGIVSLGLGGDFVGALPLC